MLLQALEEKRDAESRREKRDGHGKEYDVVHDCLLRFARSRLAADLQTSARRHAVGNSAGI